LKNPKIFKASYLIENNKPTGITSKNRLCSNFKTCCNQGFFRGSAVCLKMDKWKKINLQRQMKISKVIFVKWISSLYYWCFKSGVPRHFYFEVKTPREPQQHNHGQNVTCQLVFLFVGQIIFDQSQFNPSKDKFVSSA
jgi:hypothetical protein